MQQDSRTCEITEKVPDEVKELLKTADTREEEGRDEASRRRLMDARRLLIILPVSRSSLGNVLYK